MKEKIYKLKENAVLRKEQNGYLLIPITGEIAARGEIFYLNETALSIWSVISELDIFTTNNILKKILEEYDIPSIEKVKKVRRQIYKIITLLKTNSILEEYDGI